MTVDTTEYTERRAAAEALSRWAEAAPLGQARRIGQLGGLKLTGVVKVNYLAGGREAHVAVDTVPADPAHATLKHLQENPLGLVRQLEHRVQDLEQLRQRLLAAQHEATHEAAQAQASSGKPFKHTEALTAAQRKLNTIEDQMRAAQTHGPPPVDGPAAAGDTLPASSAQSASPPPSRPSAAASPPAWSPAARTAHQPPCPPALSPGPRLRP